jgi:hypothetical protein
MAPPRRDATAAAPVAAAARASGIPTWIIYWFTISTLIVWWDAGYGLLPVARDHTHFITSKLYYPYQTTYKYVDMFYNDGAWPSSSGLGSNFFGPAQSWMNLVENLFNITFLLLERNNDARARVVGLVAVTMTASKTILYFVCLAVLGWDKMIPSSSSDLFAFWTKFLIPNGTWIVVPSLIAYTLGSQLVAATKGAKSS